MEVTRRGRVHDGGIVFAEPLSLPEGSEVIVHIAAEIGEGLLPEKTNSGSLTGLPFFGMWADRDDMQDSAAWVRQEREKWQPPAARLGQSTDVSCSALFEV